MNSKEFIEKAREVHGDKYDYTEVEYINNRTKVCIVCHEKDKLGNEHGKFWQTPGNHLSNHGCPKCNGRGFGKEYYIELAKQIHKNKYDYSKTNFKNVTERTTIICPKHGEFKQAFNMHLLGQGCQKCYGNHKLDKEEFIKKAREVHGDKYDYSKVELTGNNKSYVIITCKEHGDFKQKINCHLTGDGCPKCSKKHRYTTEEFVEEAKKIHGDKYDYSKVNYINNHTKVCIICPKHGEFWIKPNNHLSSKQGCPICINSRLEDELYDKMPKDIEVVRRYRSEWLGRQELDFYFPNKKIAVECQGIQHFEPIEFWGGEMKLKYISNLDKEKQKKCLDNGIRLIYYTDYKINGNYIGEVFNNVDKIIDIINETSNKTQ